MDILRRNITTEETKVKMTNAANDELRKQIKERSEK